METARSIALEKDFKDDIFQRVFQEPREELMDVYVEFIPNAGACLATVNVLTEAGGVRWMVRENPHAPGDTGWLIMSSLDTSEYLDNPANSKVCNFNTVCMIEPALIGIWNFPVGSDLQIVRDAKRISVVDTPTGRIIPSEEFFVPPAWQRR